MSRTTRLRCGLAAVCAAGAAAAVTTQATASLAGSCPAPYERFAIPSDGSRPVAEAVDAKGNADGYACQKPTGKSYNVIDNRVQRKPPDFTAARQATAAYHNVRNAIRDGYGLFTDAQGIACIDSPGVGGMGIHYVKGALVGDGAVDARTPEALVYEPQPNGKLKLVAAEYVVFQADWQGSEPPSLFGQSFEAVGADNRYGLPPFYELHAWLWRANPDGAFEDFNPDVSCP